MKFDILAAAGLAALALTSAPAAAQVQGIATADTVQAIAKAKALSTAFNQIGTQYQSYTQQMDAKEKELNSLQQQLYKQFDSNGDKQIDDAELAKMDATKSPIKDQIQAKSSEIQQLQVPIVKAQMFAVGEIAKQYNTAQENVVKAKKINLILAPDAFLWAPPTVDVTPAITAEIDRLAPTVATAPPENWQPSRDVAAVYQQIMQLLGLAMRYQAAQAAAAQQQQAATPAAPAAQPQSR